jgi:hypothetical protein
MIVAVATQFHDHERRFEYVDTDKLDPDNYVDSELLKAIQANKDCWIDASDWEDHPDKFPDDDIGVSGQALIEKPDKFDHSMMLTIDFDC